MDVRGEDIGEKGQAADGEDVWWLYMSKQGKIGG